MKFLNSIFSRFNRVIPCIKPPPVEFIFDESYRISTEEMIRLIKKVSDSECWTKSFCKGVDPLVAAIRMSRIQGGEIDNNRLSVGYCYHDIEQVTAYLIRDKVKDRTLFSATKYNWANEMYVHSFHPGNWIEFIEHFRTGESESAMLDENLKRIGNAKGFLSKNPIPRHPERIPKVLKKIEELWGKVPNLRLGQFLGNCARSEVQLYHMEDDVLLENLEAMYSEADKE